MHCIQTPSLRFEAERNPTKKGAVRASTAGYSYGREQGVGSF
ncbi:MAG: hypothetical protein ACRC32_22790 [Chroococcidiopsis sp.]